MVKILLQWVYATCFKKGGLILMRKLFSIFLAALLTAACFQTVFAEAPDTPAATVHWVVSAPDEQGIITAALVVKNTAFNAMAGMVSYNPTVLQPVAKNGAAVANTANYNDFRVFVNPAFPSSFSEIGCALDINKGFISFGYFRQPGLQGPNELLSDDHLIHADAVNGFAVYQFSFKVLRKGLYGFGLAYDENGFGGLTLAKDSPAGIIETAFIVHVPGMDPVEELPVETKPGQPIPVNTEQEIALRANNTVILKIDNPNATANGAKVPVDPDDTRIVPYIKSGADRTMVPVRFIAESLGADVSYVQAEGKVVIVFGDKTIHMFLDSKEWTINGVAQTPLDTPAELLYDARTFVPFRAIGEALDMHVDWVAADDVVVVSPKENPIDLTREIDSLFYQRMLTMILS